MEQNIFEIAEDNHCPVCGLEGCDYMIVNNWIIIHVPLPENEHRIKKIVIAPGKAKLEVDSNV